VGGGELAIRLAIGETQVIQENKEYFLSHGVDIDSLESALSNSKSSSTNTSSARHSSASSKSVERSTTTLLIKNLPHDVVGEELEDMFTRSPLPSPPPPLPLDITSPGLDLLLLSYCLLPKLLL
jgi:hypothetical protein